MSHGVAAFRASVCASVSVQPSAATPAPFRRRGRSHLGVALLALLAWLAPIDSGFAQADVEDRPIQHLVFKPAERASWSPSNLLGFLRPGYTSERTLRIETTPPGALLDLFYVRASFQKRYEQVRAPVVLELPRRVEAGTRDSITVRAFKEGYRLETAHIPVRGGENHLVIDLGALPNSLVAVGHTYFSGRAGLSLMLKESPGVRMQKADNGFTVILDETSRGSDVESLLSGIQSPLVDRIESQQIGEDLLLRVRLTAGSTTETLDLRSRQSHDPARNLYRYSVDLIPEDQGAESIERARSELSRIAAHDVIGCAARYDDALHAALDAEQLARALTPRGEFTDPYLRAALRRLGEVSPGGAIHLRDGRRYRPEVPLELAAAASEAAAAEGYLALLRRWVALLEPASYRTEALRSLIAPETDSLTFEGAVADALSAERICRQALAGGALRGG